eukprot:1053937-Rhodomonas_salina.2
MSVALSSEGRSIAFGLVATSADVDPTRVPATFPCIMIFISLSVESGNGSDASMDLPHDVPRTLHST